MSNVNATLATLVSYIICREGAPNAPRVAKGAAKTPLLVIRAPNLEIALIAAGPWGLTPFNPNYAGGRGRNVVEVTTPEEAAEVAGALNAAVIAGAWLPPMGPFQFVEAEAQN